MLKEIGTEIVKYFQCDAEVMTEIEGIDLMCANINKTLEKLSAKDDREPGISRTEILEVLAKWDNDEWVLDDILTWLRKKEERMEDKCAIHCNGANENCNPCPYPLKASGGEKPMGRIERFRSLGMKVATSIEELEEMMDKNETPPEPQTAVQLHASIVKGIKNKLIAEFLKTFDSFEEEMVFQLKEGTFNKDTTEVEYWKGFRYGLQMFWTDFVLPEKEEWEAKLK